MKKKFFILCLAAVMSLTLAACNEPADQDGGDKDAVKFQNLNEFIASNLSLYCKWSYSEDGTNASGELYGQGNRFNQTAEYAEGSQVISITSISDGEWLYMWNSVQGGRGSKIEMAKLDALNQKMESENSGQKSVNLNKDINLVCYPWPVDDSKFMPPADIDFMDLSDMIFKTSEMTESGSMCASCSYLPEGPQKDECLASLNCQ